ncbi:hypothetical protein SNK05_013596 [Fusarium graminearum]
MFQLHHLSIYQRRPHDLVLAGVSYGAFFVDRVGRRVLFLFAGVGMLISFTIWTACSAVYVKTESSSTAGIAKGQAQMKSAITEVEHA